MRCPDCKKFTSYGDPDVDDIEVTLDGSTLTLSGPLSLTCGECGTTVAATELSAEQDVADQFPSPPFEPVPEGKEDDVEYAIEGSPDIEPVDRLEDTDKHGKKVKNPRGMRHFYGVAASVTVSRKLPGAADANETIDVTIEAEAQASAFEPIC